jgi:Fe-Mn family superoxide dismutase
MSLPHDVSRRKFLESTAVGGTAVMLAALQSKALAQENGSSAEPFTLPELPYDYSALEPYIDARTMEIHHTKHHAAYINNLNTAIEGTSLANETIEQIVANLADVPEIIRTTVRNNGGGHANHDLFWKIMAPEAGGEPTGALASAINNDLGGFADFKEKFSDAAMKRFGSGWAWLSVKKDKKLVVESTPNQDSPLTNGHTPILGIDVWEHAYYLHYQNRRGDYVSEFFNVINWPEVERRYGEAVG